MRWVARPSRLCFAAEEERPPSEQESFATNVVPVFGVCPRRSTFLRRLPMTRSNRCSKRARRYRVQRQQQCGAMDVQRQKRLALRSCITDSIDFLR